MGSEGGEVRQSSVSTRGKTQLPELRIKLQRGLRLPQTQGKCQAKEGMLHTMVSCWGRKAELCKRGKRALCAFSHHEVTAYVAFENLESYLFITL